MIKAVIFDCFGVLIENGLGILDKNFNPSQAQWDEMEVYRRQADAGLIETTTLQAEMARIFKTTPDKIQQLLGNLHKMKPVFDLVTRLKEAGYKTALLSNVSPDFIEIYFSTEDKLIFDAMILSYEHGYTKPDRRIYTDALNALALSSEECVFIDDSQTNVAGAEKAGMHGIVYAGVEDLKKRLNDFNVKLAG